MSSGGSACCPGSAHCYSPSSQRRLCLPSGTSGTLPASNGAMGERSRSPATFLIIGGVMLLIIYVAFVVPLVLLWPVRAQRKYWCAMLCASMLWPPLFSGILHAGRSPLIVFAEIRQSPGFYCHEELFALCCCACYLLLVRWE